MGRKGHKSIEVGLSISFPKLTRIVKMGNEEPDSFPKTAKNVEMRSEMTVSFLKMTENVEMGNGCDIMKGENRVK